MLVIETHSTWSTHVDLLQIFTGLTKKRQLITIAFTFLFFWLQILKCRERKLKHKSPLLGDTFPILLGFSLQPTFFTSATINK